LVNNECTATGHVTVVSTRADAAASSFLISASGVRFGTDTTIRLVANFEARPLSSTGPQSGSAQSPEPPGRLSASAVNRTSVQLTWVDNSDNEEGFRVTYSGAASTRTTLTAGRNTGGLLVSGLSPGVRYCFEIVAFNATGSSLSVGPACTTTPTGGR
jgi:titin